MPQLRSHPRRRNAPPPLRFSRKLVLHQWLLGLFGVERFDRLAEHLRDESLEGLDADNVHHFHHALCLHLPAERRPALPDEVLLEHDQAIVAVTARLNEPRIVRGERPIAWKYFQYLALLFTEIYLDRWFRDPRALLAALNAHVAAFNEGKAEADRISPFGEATTETEASAQLDKLAFWMATGSGKTLLMHAHVLQYRRLLVRHGRARDLNRILLLTPNEGLSRQHLRELETAGIEAEIFDKRGRGPGGRGLFAGRAVEILEITRLRDEMGDRTVAVEAFEGNNLVLIDEGHRGAAAGEEGAWMRFRNALCEKGFSFEYSATFGQAVKGNPALGDLYFHPDFILWLLAGDRQHVTFVDPKGIRNVGVDDPKIRFFETIKEIERRLGDPKVALDSFIVSRTPSHVMKKLWGTGKPDMAARHVAFQEEDRGSYIGAMLRGIGDGRAAGSGR